MIEPLTREKLIEYGFDELAISRFFDFENEWDNYEYNLQNEAGFFVASKSDRLIYSGKDGARCYYFKNPQHPAFPLYCIELISEYFLLSEAKYFNEIKSIIGVNLFDENDYRGKFIEAEILRISEVILNNKRFKGFKHVNEIVEKYEYYLNWLKKIQANSNSLNTAKMDYLQILIDGYFIENNRNFLGNYFYREFKKAEKEHYEANEFFNGCFSIVNHWENELKNIMFNQQNKWYLAIENAKAGNMKLAFHEGDEGRTDEQKLENAIALFQKELEFSKNINNHSLQLSFVTNNRIARNIMQSEIDIIRNAINEASLKANEKHLDVTNQTPNKTFDSKLTSAQLIQIFEFITEIALFKKPFSLSDLESIFNSKASKPYEITSNINLAILLSCLSNKGFISKEWQSVIEKNQCFKGKKSPKPMNANTIAGALNKINRHSDIYKKIDRLIDTLN